MYLVIVLVPCWCLEGLVLGKRFTISQAPSLSYEIRRWDDERPNSRILLSNSWQLSQVDHPRHTLNSGVTTGGIWISGSQGIQWPYNGVCHNRLGASWSFFPMVDLRSWKLSSGNYSFLKKKLLVANISTMLHFTFSCAFLWRGLGWLLINGSYIQNKFMLFHYPNTIIIPLSFSYYISHYPIFISSSHYPQ